MVQFVFDGKTYNFTSGSKVLSFARSTWGGEFSKHSEFTKAYEEAAFKERYPKGYEVVDPRAGTTRWVSPEEAYPPKAEAEVSPPAEAPIETKPAVPLTAPLPTVTGTAVPGMVPIPGLTWSAKGRLESALTRFEREVGGLRKSEAALTKVIGEVGDIEELHEASQVREKLGEYTKDIQTVMGVNNAIISLYNRQISEVRADFTKNTAIHDEVVANKDDYSAENYKEHLENWKKYEASVKAAIGNYEKAIISHKDNVQGLQTALAESKAEKINVIEWAKGKLAILRELAKPQVMEYSVTYVEDGKQKIKTFTTERDQLTFVIQRQDEQMQKANFKGSWSDFTKKVKNQQAYISWLAAKGVIELKDGEASLLKPITVLTDEEIGMAHKAGFDVPKLPLGASLSLYQWAKDTLPPGTFRREATEAVAAMIGQFTDVLWAPYRWVASIIPGEQLYEKGFRVVTPATMKYVEDLTPAQQVALDVGGVAATAGAAYIAALPVGLTVRGVTSMAGAIGTRLGTTAPKALERIAKYLTAHPKVMQAVVWAPMAGLEAARVYDSIQKGKPVEEIIRDEAYRIAGMYGGLKGFKAGYNLIPAQKWARLQRLIKIEEFDDPRHPGQKRLLPTIDSKKIPKELADLLRIELDPVSGKEIVVGPATEAGITRNVGREYGKLLKDLVAGKAVTTDPINAVRGTILDYATPDQLTSLFQRGLNIETMSAQEIADLMFKELNWAAGSPWQELLQNAEMEFLQKGGRTTVDVLTAFSERLPQEGIMGLTKGRDLVNMLVSDGMSQQQALMYATEILTASPTTLVQVAAEAGLSQQMTQNLVGASLAYGAASADGTALVQSLSKAGLTMQETKSVLPLLLQQRASATAIIQQLPKLSVDALAIVIPVLNQGNLQQALPQLATPVLVRVAPALDSSVIDSLLPRLDHDALIKIVPALRDDVLISVLPSLKPIELSDMMSELTKNQIKILIDQVPDLTLDQIAYTVPWLDTDQITSVIQTMQFDTPSLITTIEGITPGIIPGLPRFMRRFRAIKRGKRSRSLEPYKVTFRRAFTDTEVHRVRAHSFREALIIAWKIKKIRGDPSEVEVEKLKVKVK